MSTERKDNNQSREDILSIIKNTKLLMKACWEGNLEQVKYLVANVEPYRSKLAPQWALSMQDDPNLRRARLLAKEDFDAIMEGNIVIASSAPMGAKGDFKKWRDYGFYIGDNWDKESSHMFALFLNPDTNTIDVATGYSFPTQPINFAGYLGKGKALDWDRPDSKLTWERVIERDIMYALDTQTRADHNTTSVVMKTTLEERQALAKALENGRTKTHLQIDKELTKNPSDNIADRLPLHYTAAQQDEALLNQQSDALYQNRTKEACQSLTFQVLRAAMPDRKIPVAYGTAITSLKKEDPALWSLETSPRQPVASASNAVSSGPSEETKNIEVTSTTKTNKADVSKALVSMIEAVKIIHKLPDVGTVYINPAKYGANLAIALEQYPMNMTIAQKAEIIGSEIVRPLIEGISDDLREMVNQDFNKNIIINTKRKEALECIGLDVSGKQLGGRRI